MSSFGDPLTGVLGHPLVVAFLAFMGVGAALVVAAWWWSSRRLS